MGGEGSEGTFLGKAERRVQNSSQSKYTGKPENTVWLENALMVVCGASGSWERRW